MKINYINIFAVVLVVIALGYMSLLFTNRKLYCDIAMFGSLGQVPAVCLQQALEELKN